MRKILITVPAWMQNDAIGTDVTMFYEQLTRAGWQVFVYTAGYDPAFADYIIKNVAGLRKDLIERGLANVQRFSRERTAQSLLVALDGGLRWEPGKSLVRRRRWRSLLLRQRVQLMQLFRKVTRCVVRLLRTRRS